VWHWRRLLQWMPIRGLGAALLLLLLVVFSTPATNVALALSSALCIAEHACGRLEQQRETPTPKRRLGSTPQTARSVESKRGLFTSAYYGFREDEKNALTHLETALNSA